MPRKRTKAVTEDTPIEQETVVDQAKLVSPPDPAQHASDTFAGQTAPHQQAKVAEIVQSVADATKMPEDAATGFAARTQTNSVHIANPSSVRRPTHVEAARKLPCTLSINAGDLRVDLVDKGDNLAGIGVRVAVPDGRKLSDDEKAVIREHMKFEGPNNPPFTWNQQAGIWVKPIVRENEFEDQVPLSRPVAIRLDGERRVAAIADDLRQLQADPAGFAETVKQRREHAANAGRIPD